MSKKADIKKKVSDAIYEKLSIDFLDNIAVDIASDVKEYDPEWVEPLYGVSQYANKLEKAMENFSDVLANYLMTGYSEEAE